jgi:hypothetical protein
VLLSDLLLWRNPNLLFHPSSFALAQKNEKGKQPIKLQAGMNFFSQKTPHVPVKNYKASKSKHFF